MFKKKVGFSKLLKDAISKYQYDIVGWTEFCIENKNLKQKALPKIRENSFEDLRMRERNLSNTSNPPLKTVFASKGSYIKHLDKEYIKDQAFYEAILKNPGKYRASINDNLLNEEIDRSAKKYLKNIKKRKIDEEKIINSIKPEDWLEISKSKYPKIHLGLMLGLSRDAIINNFGLYFINQLKAEFMAARTAYITSSGPSSWHEIERIEKELAYFNKEVVSPLIKKFDKDKNK
ncbi:MAG: hypothetical protein AYK22_02170 [Thermoplasmatales archaeon SG8-52-3]|nr:MAG: hypothetical protein AYK22_02170 [Thermoplasmatales archaeon SG8-52-3]